MINAEDFFDQIAAVTKHQINDRKVRIGYIDSDFEEHLYPEIQPRVYLDGEGLTHRGYPCVSSYAPMRGDRVILLPVGENYVILGSIERADRDLLVPGQMVFYAERNTTQSIPTGDGNGVALQWNVVTMDLLGSLAENGSNLMDRFRPPVPGWYRFYGSIGFAENTTGTRRARWRLNGNLIDGGHVSFTAPTGQASVVAPTVPVFLNGSTDYVQLEAAQLSGGALNTSTGTLRPQMSVDYVGPPASGSAPSRLSLE